MKPISRHQLWTACLGNLFEHYDTALFSFLSPFLAPLIFPEQNPITALILTYAIIPLGMLARPLGSVVFGYIGDLYGRNYALFLTLAGMASISCCIALTPTYMQAGILSPILFSLGRVLQNFFAAGETMGGAIFLLENTPKKNHDILSGLYSSTTIGGYLLASLGVFIISFYDVVEIGWRILYLCGCFTGLFGCVLRRFAPKEVTSVTFAQTLSNYKESFWSHRKALLMIMVCSGFSYANYVISLVLMNGFIPLVSTVSKTEIMKINSFLLIFDFCALPFFGWLASKISREKLMLYASLAVLLFSIPLVLLLEGGSLVNVIGVRVVFVIIGVAFCAPFHAWVQELIPSASRYVVISLGYALGTQLLGGPTAALALWSFHKTGMITSVCWYWILLALFSCMIIGLKMRSKKPKLILQMQ